MDSAGFKKSASYGGIIKCSSTGKYLLVQGKTGKWSFPKGHREKDETECECAVREIYEETGLTISDISSKQIIHPHSYYYFFIELDDEHATNIIDHAEIKDIKWFSLDEIKTIQKNVDVSVYFKKLKI